MNEKLLKELNAAITDYTQQVEKETYEKVNEMLFERAQKIERLLESLTGNEIYQQCFNSRFQDLYNTRLNAHRKISFIYDTMMIIHKMQYGRNRNE